MYSVWAVIADFNPRSSKLLQRFCVIHTAVSKNTSQPVQDVRKDVCLKTKELNVLNSLRSLFVADG